MLLFTFIVKRIAGKKPDFLNSPLNIPFMLLILISLLSFVNSVNLHSSLQGITKLFKYGFLIIALVNEVKDREHIKKIIIASLFGLMLASLDGIYQFIFGVDFFRHKPYDTIIGLVRLKAAFPHTNIFAGYLALFLPLCAALFFWQAKGAKKLFLGLISLAGFFCLVFTFSRSAVFGSWLAVFLAAIAKKSKVIIAVFIALLLAAPFLAPKGIRDWTKETSSLAEFLLNKERMPLYETSFNMIRRHPVVGVGVNTYCLNYQKYKLHDTSEETADTNWYAHNSYLHMASEIGIIGFLVFISLILILLIGWFRFYLKERDAFLKIGSLGIALGLFAFLVHGLTESNLYYPKIAVLFWFQVGFLARIIYFKKEGANG
jgi:O-antigen ligase